MAFSQSLLQYWTGSAWVTALTPASNSALISVQLIDKMGQPMMMEARLSNKSNNPFSATLSDAKGKLSGVLADFQRVRLIDDATRFVLFYGRIYKSNEDHDLSYGNILTLACSDALEELKDTVTDGAEDINVDGAGSDTYPTPASPTTSVSKRSGLIKGFLSLFSKSGNLTFASDATRFNDSAVAFAGASGEYPLKDSGNKSALSHIASAAKDDPHTTARKTLTYDYYVDPNFQNTGAVTPAAFFNYFKRGTRPTATPATYGLRVEYPTGGGLTRTGRIYPMMSDYGFERPRAELFTDAACHYMDEGPDTLDGSTNKDKGFDSEERTVRLELIKVKNISAAFTWQGKAIGGGVVGTDSAEYLTGNNAKIQYVSATSGGTDGDPEYALISDVTNSFPNSGTITGQTSGSTFVIVSRPRETYGIIKTARLGATNINNADVIREQAVSRLRRSTDPIIRGRCRIINKPWFHVETASTTVSGTTITFGGGFNPQSYGFKIGMTVTKVSATGTVQSYGYATSVTSSTVVVGNGMSATVSSGDIVRLYVPVRASDTTYIVNKLVNITGSDFLITEMQYSEDNGVLNTEIQVVGAESGLGPVQNVVGAVVTAATEKERYETGAGNRRIDKGLKLTSKFTHDGTNPHTTIDWSAGQLTVGGTSFKITAGTSVFGATGEYYLYHTGVEGSTGFSASLTSSYVTNKQHVLVAWVKVNSTSDSSSKLEFKTLGQVNASVPDIGNASSVLNSGSVTTTQLDATFVADTAGKTKVWYQSGPPDGDGSDNVGVGDLWVDSDDLRVYRAASANADAIAAGEWVLVNEGDAIAALANTLAGTANTLAGTANTLAGTKNTLNRQNEAWKNSNSGVNTGDILMAVDTERLWTWSSGNAWVLRVDTGAINYGTTDINGGRIDTNNIVLTAAGGKILSTGNAGDDSSGTKVILSDSGIFGYNGGSDQFSIHTADGKAYFGANVIKMARDGLTVGDIDLGAGVGAVTWKYILDPLGTPVTTTYKTYNYLGILYLSTSGVSSPALAPTNSYQFSLGTNDFGWKQIYLGQSSGATERLWSDAGTLKWGSAALASSGVVIESGKDEFLAVYKDDGESPSGFSTTINGLDYTADQGQTYRGWKGGGTGDIYPSVHGYSMLGIGYQSPGSDHGFKAAIAKHDSAAGDPPYSFSTYNTTGISHDVVSGGSRLVIEVSDQDVCHFGTTGVILMGSKGIKPTTNNGSYIGSNTTNAWTESFGSDMRIGSGNFYDFSTSRKAVFHWAHGPTAPEAEPAGGWSIDDSTQSRVHIYCPMYYVPAQDPANFETSVDLEVITYANSNQYRVVRSSSTARAKDNIRDLDVDTSKVWDLQPRSFEWKGGGTPAFGLIAEEVDEILPELVTYWQDDENYGVHGSGDMLPQGIKYKYLSVLLLAEMKNLKARIEELEKEKDNG